MTHDYKGALKWAENTTWANSYGDNTDGEKMIKTIRHALLIADRVMGEPSAAMINTLMDAAE